MGKLIKTSHWQPKQEGPHEEHRSKFYGKSEEDIREFEKMARESFKSFSPVSYSTLVKFNQYDEHGNKIIGKF